MSPFFWYVALIWLQIFGYMRYFTGKGGGALKIGDHQTVIPITVGHTDVRNRLTVRYRFAIIDVRSRALQ